MITSSDSQLELKFEVIIHDGLLDFTSIQRVNIELSENMHDLATLDIAGIPPEYLTTYIDLPVAIKLTVARTHSCIFKGYITYLEPESINKNGLVNKSPFQTTRMYCIGTSYVMRNRRTDVWNNVTLSQIVRTLADRYNLTASVPNDPYVFPRLVQSGESDWSLLRKACEYLGYRVSMRTTHIDIWDPFTTLSRYGTAPLYAMAGNRGILNAEPGQVISFNASVGAVTPESAKVPDTIHALVDNEVVTISKDISTGYGNPVQSIFEDEVPANAMSIPMANAVLQGRSRFKFPYTAHLTVVGNPSIQPGMLIQLGTYNSSVDGLWIVKSARHEAFRGSSMTYLTVEKDSEFSSIIDPLEKVFPSIPIPESVIKDFRWISTRELVNVYS
jgi:hypothetical protein